MDQHARTPLRLAGKQSPRLFSATPHFLRTDLAMKNAERASLCDHPGWNKWLALSGFVMRLSTGDFSRKEAQGPDFRNSQAGAGIDLRMDGGFAIFPARDYRHACSRNESSGNYPNPVFSFGSVKYDRRGARALNKALVANGVLNTSGQAVNGTVRRYPCHDIAILVLNIKLQNSVLALGKRTELEQEKTAFRINRWFPILIFVKGEGERDIIQRNSGPIGDNERQTTVRPYSASAVQFHRQLSILGRLLLGNRCMQGQDTQDC
jgi:hypothetical protein